MIWIFLITGLAESTRAASVTWQILPFYSNSDWPGPFGQPAVTNNNQVLLYGQPVRTVQTFSRPATISFDVVLTARAATEGSFQFKIQPPGVPTNESATTVTFLFMNWNYQNSGQDTLFVQQNDPGSHAFDSPFTFDTQTVDHVTIGISATGQLSWTINGQAYDIPGTVVVSYPEFQLELEGWVPGIEYVVSNFSVEASTGCSVADICPCEGPSGGGSWRNHGKYVACVSAAANAFVKAGRINQTQRSEIVRQAGQSNCGGH